MVFTSPSWVEKLPFDPPDTCTVGEFMLNDKYGRRPLAESLPPFTCGLSGLEYSALEVKERTEFLARGLSKELGWKPNAGTEWDKVMGVFSVNTIDVFPLAWATHRLNGISTPANATYNAEELAYQLKSSGASCLFTCLPLLSTAIDAASKVGIPRDRVYLLEVPKEVSGGGESPKGFKSVGQLIEEGSHYEPLEPLKWEKGQGARQVAFLCYSSGTSGLPKGVMISHRNVISNVMQITTFEKPYRRHMVKAGEPEYLDVALGLLPQSHIYSLVAISHISVWRGDRCIVLPKFGMDSLLQVVQDYKINSLYLVPPIIILMIRNKKLLDRYDLSSVKQLYTGAAPLGRESSDEVAKMYPDWYIRQGYGLTECCTVVSSTPYDDVDSGSSGSLLPGIQAKIVSVEGKEITGYDQPGEILLRSPACTLGYLNNEEATKEVFQDGWVRTGDEAVIRKSPRGHEHVWIVDRIKELIKVNGLQVAPAELEAHILTHPAVADCAVVSIPDEKAGEAPKAYVVKNRSVGIEENERMIARDIQKHVEKHKARHKWIKEVEFIDVIPKSVSGKILRRLLRAKDAEQRRKRGSRL